MKGFCAKKDLILQPLSIKEYNRLYSVSNVIIEKENLFYTQTSFDEDQKIAPRLFTPELEAQQKYLVY